MFRIGIPHSYYKFIEYFDMKDYISFGVNDLAEQSGDGAEYKKYW
jgi:hypothetical protein